MGFMFDLILQVEDIIKNLTKSTAKAYHRRRKHLQVEEDQNMPRESMGLIRQAYMKSEFYQETMKAWRGGDKNQSTARDVLCILLWIIGSCNGTRTGEFLSMSVRIIKKNLCFRIQCNSLF